MIERAKMMVRTRRFSSLLALLLVAGCITARPRYFPPAPLEVTRLPDGGCERLYDTTGDGRGDYRERLSPDGRVVMLRYDVDVDGVVELEVDRTRPIAADADEHSVRPPVHLLIIADSVPFEMVRDLYAHGRFRLFHPPRRVISPFPAMTDTCLNELFGTSPADAVETEYYDGQRFRDGFGPYTREANSAWLAKVDYHLPYSTHGHVYLDPRRWFEKEMADIQHAVFHTADAALTAYVVSTSALGMQMGRDGHATGLVRLDRFCQAIMHRMQGRIEITLMSDHGHELGASRLLPLRQGLIRMGYRVTGVLEEPQDVVVPAFGLVNCAAVYTPSPASVARDLVSLEGVDLTAYRDESDNVIVLSRDGVASVSKSGGKYRYVAECGDPLRLKTILANLARHKLVNAEGFVDDGALFEATTDHIYPDPLHRLHRAFHGLCRHAPDVLISLADGWCWGSPFMSGFLTVSAAHGSLKRFSSTGFVMTTAGPLPPVMRMENVAEELRRAGATGAGQAPVDAALPTVGPETAGPSGTDRSE